MERCSNESVFFSYLISLQSSGSPEALSTFSAVHNRGAPLKQKKSEDLEKSITVRAINFSPSEYITYPDLLSWPSVLEQTFCPTDTVWLRWCVTGYGMWTLSKSGVSQKGAEISGGSLARSVNKIGTNQSDSYYPGTHIAGVPVAFIIWKKPKKQHDRAGTARFSSRWEAVKEVWIAVAVGMV